MIYFELTHPILLYVGCQILAMFITHSVYLNISICYCYCYCYCYCSLLNLSYLGHSPKIDKDSRDGQYSPMRDGAMACLNFASEWIAQQVIYHSFICLFSFFEDNAWCPSLLGSLRSCLDSSKLTFWFCPNSRDSLLNSSLYIIREHFVLCLVSMVCFLCV